MCPPALPPAGLASAGPASAGPAPAALGPVQELLAALRQRRGITAVHGLHPQLVVTNPEEWIPAAHLVDGSALPEMLDSARLRWDAQPHAAAALAWKSYTYWLAVPVALGYACALRVPLLPADDVLVRFHDRQPFLTIGVRPGTPAAALAATPAPAAASSPVACTGLVAVPDHEALLMAMREALLDRHLLPLVDRIRATVNIGRRTLLGSVASGMAYAVVRAASALPCLDGPDAAIATAGRLLDALDVADLVTLTVTPDGGVAVQRHTCCLAFTLPEPKICSGCCIRAA